MKKIIMSGEIGYEVTADKVRNRMNEAAGDNLDVRIASAGGFVSKGLEIYSLFSDYRRDYPDSQMFLTLTGLVASMASYIASNPAFDIIKAEDNAVFMMHNPYAVSIGDYRDMEKSREILFGLTKMLSNSYAFRAKKPVEDMQKLMDAETWYFGNEIKEAGFVDEMIPGGTQKEEKTAALANARLKFENLMDKMRESEKSKNDISRIAALIQIEPVETAPEPFQTKENEISGFIDPMGPYANEHAARIHDPSKYDSFARADNTNENFKDLPSGVSVILGIKEGKSEIQAFRFSIDHFTAEEAKKWLDDHKIKYISFEPAKNKSSKSSATVGDLSPAATGEKNKEVPMDIKEMQEKHPELYAEILKAGSAAEIQRIKDVKAQSMPGHEALIDAFILDGHTTGAEAAIAVVKAENDLKKKGLDALAKHEPVAGANAPDPKIAESKAASDDDTPVETRAKAEWEKSKEVRTEYGTFEVYLAYKKNLEAGNIRIKGEGGK